jgi:hypothetical protein
MKVTKIYAIIISVSVLLMYSAIVVGQEVDYSSYEIAKKYQRDGNSLFAYKHLLIFKYSNLERLRKPENRPTLKTLDNKIEEYENLLQQNVSWFEVKKYRGFSDVELDSALNTKLKKITLENIKVQ